MSQTPPTAEASTPQKGANQEGAGGARRTVMSGMRTTGPLHIGHYFGTLRYWLKLQEQDACYFGAMDLHAMTTAYKRTADLEGFRRDMIATWVAFGIDPERSVMFVQSRVPEHIELFAFFAMITPMGWLERVPSWKDAEEEAKASETHNLGRFSYPVLQAADIAVYRGTHVPVGQDQVAHLELNREIIRRFNFLYKTKLPEPQALLTDTPVLAGTDGRKMSKSYSNYFGLIQEEKELQKNVKLMVTDPQRVRREDPGDPEVCSVYSYHKLFSPPQDVAWAAEGCRTAGIGCGDCKAKLFENINSFMKVPREKHRELLKDSHSLDSIIESGCERARDFAMRNLAQIRDKMKFEK